MKYILIQVWTLLFIFPTFSSPYHSSMTVYVFPPASSLLFVCCWTNSTTAPFNHSQEFSTVSEISWEMTTTPRTPSYYDGYWCRARMGSNLLVRWSVYGDGQDRNSSEWIINSRGRRRLSVNGRFMDDQRGSWVVT